MKNILKFTIQGKPTPKKRARKGAYGNWYNPISGDMSTVLKELKKQIPIDFEMIEKNIPVEVNFLFFFEPAKSQQTKKFIKQMNNELVPFLKKADLDNLWKFYTDLMSDVIYYDDNQIYKSFKEKYYSENPRTEIEIIW